MSRLSHLARDGFQWLVIFERSRLIAFGSTRQRFHVFSLTKKCKMRDKYSTSTNQSDRQLATRNLLLSFCQCFHIPICTDILSSQESSLLGRQPNSNTPTSSGVSTEKRTNESSVMSVFTVPGCSATEVTFGFSAAT